MAEEPVAKRHQPQEEFSEELLRMYYDRIFPANLMCRWLSYGSQHEENAGARLLPHREFSFTTGDDVYIRYLSYEDAAGLKKDLMNKRKQTPLHLAARSQLSSPRHHLSPGSYAAGCAAEARE